MKNRIVILSVLLLAAVGLLGALSAQTGMRDSHHLYLWNGPVASPDTLRVTPPAKNWPIQIDYLYVSSPSDTARAANVAIWRYTGGASGADTLVDTLVCWQGKIPGAPRISVAPYTGWGFASMFAPEGGLFESRPNDTLKVIVTAAAASSLYIMCKYELGK